MNFQVNSITDFYHEYLAMYTRTLTLEDVDFYSGEISKYKGKQTSIIIPEYFKVNGTDIRVTTIGSRAFSWKNLTSVIIPNTVTKIDWGAFFVNNLSGITIDPPLSPLPASDELANCSETHTPASLFLI